jgi:tetraacyldisaccharide 4'-kinase
LFPLGRLREPIEGLARAGIVLITRSAFSDLTPAIVNTVRRYNPDAPVFRASVVPDVWVEPASGREYPVAQPPFERAGVFCGLGNPLAFRRTLESLGVTPVDMVEFPDHHRYRPHELRRAAEQMAAQGAKAMVTTEKDVVNLCDDWKTLIAPLPLYWLKVTMGIECEPELVELVLKVTSRSSVRLPQGPPHS